MTQPASVLRKMRTLSVDAEIVALALGGASGHAPCAQRRHVEEIVVAVDRVVRCVVGEGDVLPGLGQATRSSSNPRKMARARS